ncbi:MAG: glutamine synthetase [Gammaproteobacteria bacterium]|nr:glutamine synthetase [Gammaproteobacteria bacterium]
MSTQGMLSLIDLRNATQRGEIDTVVVAFTDMFGRLIGKRFHAEYFCESAWSETHACNYLLANDIDMEPVPGYDAASWNQGYGDFVMKPVMSTLRRIPWLTRTALVLCDVQDHHGHDLAYSPRAMLKAQVDKLAARQMKAFFASELEFYLFRETYASARDKRWTGIQTAAEYMQDYHILSTTREEPVMQAIRNGIHAAGIPVENSKGEWGRGQEELNVRYTDALTMADRHVVLKNGVKEIADLAGWAVTFMAKWHYDLAGSSCHIHASLWDSKGQTALFHDPKAPLGMSTLMRQFMAGQLRYAADLTWFLAPFVNSYKRFQQTGTFAPTRIVWSDDNRTAGFRLCGAGSRAIRTECRIGGADLNPYLAFAALLAAGMAGIDEELELPSAYSGDAYYDSTLKHIPGTLREAMAALDHSLFLRSIFGDAVIDHYVRTAAWEQAQYDRRITDWELQRGFERY